jgi:hypothetical protein
VSKRRVSRRLEAKLGAIEQWVAAVRGTDTEAANRAASDGLRLSATDGDPFAAVFKWLGTIGPRLWIRDQVVVNRVERCSFCLRLSSSSDVEKLVAGPAAFICSLCIDAAAATDRTTVISQPVRCRFCGQLRDVGTYQKPDAAVCRECIDLCAQLMVDVRKGEPEWQ